MPVFSPPRLRAWRHVRDLDIAQLAQLCRLPAGEVDWIEHGTITPTVDTIAMLAGALQIDLAQLFTADSDPMNNRHYWRVITRAWPPLSDRAVMTVAEIFDRIDARHPPTGD